MSIAIKYTIFAILATLVNIWSQYLVLLIYQGVAKLYLAMFFGTLIGLIFKYILDKKYIFYYETKTKIEDSKKVYTILFNGVFLLLLYFGGLEIGFGLLFLIVKIAKVCWSYNRTFL